MDTRYQYQKHISRMMNAGITPVSYITFIRTVNHGNIN
jgi:hypothetical protein